MDLLLIFENMFTYIISFEGNQEMRVMVPQNPETAGSLIDVKKLGKSSCRVRGSHCRVETAE